MVNLLWISCGREFNICDAFNATFSEQTMEQNVFSQCGNQDVHKPISHKVEKVGSIY